MILCDNEIANECRNPKRPMISPFVPVQKGKPSYGLGSFGYDLRLGSKFLIHQPHITGYLDPLAVDTNLFKKVVAESKFYIQPHTQVLAETLETFNMPDDVFAMVIGKSTYARLGLLVNCTPVEPGWKGILTLELANLTPVPIVLHIGKGIAQVSFFRGKRPLRTYTEKESGGIYQNQPGVTVPR